MTIKVNTREAKSRLSELIRQAEAGREVIVARNGRPVAKIIPWPPARPDRRFGEWEGLVEVHDAIVGPDPEIAAAFAGSNGTSPIDDGRS